MMHHGSQGSEIDLDIPSDTEARIFRSAPMKMLWAFLMPLFYTLRPMILKPAPLNLIDIVCWIIQIAFDVWVVV